MPSNTDRTTVYTIYAGMIPTLGFEMGDFSVERRGNIGQNQTRGKSLDIGTSISPRGRQRKARVKGSVAWYEYSTTVKAIHEEVLGGDEQGSDAHNVLRWPTDWKAMFESGNRGLAEEFANSMDPDILAPTGVEHEGKKGQPSEQETSIGDISIESPDDKLEKASGRLVNKAHSVDIYVTGRDTNIYRLDVTSMSMDSGRAHHGLGSKAGRTAAGVDSASLMSDISAGNIPAAEARLLDYFQGRTEEYNTIILGLKNHMRQSNGKVNTWLKTLNLDNIQDIEDIRRDIETNLKVKERKPDIETLRPNLKQAMNRLERQGISAATSQGNQAGFESAVVFALHALGTVVQSRNTVTEYRITAPNAPVPYTIGVEQRIHSSGEQVLEFMMLNQENVRIRNEAALENHYLRVELQRRNVQDIEEVLRRNAIDRNYMDSAAMAMGDNNALEVGAIATSANEGISRDAHNLNLGAQVVMSDREFNESIDNWIRTVGSGQGYKGRLHQFLGAHLQQGPMIEHANRGQNQRNRYAQTAAPVGTDMTSLNTFNIIANPPGVWVSQPSGYRNESPEGIGLTRDANYGGQDTIPGYPKDRRNRSTIAGDLLSGALGPAGAEGARTFMSAPSNTTNNPTNVWGIQMANAALRERRTGYTRTGEDENAVGIWRKTKSAAPGGLTGETRKYWGLGEYLSDDQRSGFDDNVNPYWFAAPYISLYYPSGQVGSR